ncbi:sulfate/molybdate ABC transporter ATP-binding protein [Microbacterium sp. NPDC055910]|uniref:sulfate/molybdate ABC transporter ATP-binding protein n=1 Tax=Microbacterium sp. NPDC055910 TaxID=3345659 RepID=UPI0035D53B0D
MTGEALDARVVVERAGFRLEAHVRAAAGEVIALMGPSGAGKSTLLGALAGLVGLDEGRITLDDRVLDAAPRPRTHVTPAQRRVVLLGQDPRLFPHLSARANIAFGRRVRGVSAAAAGVEADEWLARVGLEGMGARRPAQLSGGQQQRVALARALATAPAALLLDEPLTSLDPETAGDIRTVLHDQLAATGTTAIIATHDAVDAVALATRLVILEAGAVTQAGAVRDVFAVPATRFAAAVAGVNRVSGRVRDGRFVAGGLEFAASGIADGPAAAVFAPSRVQIARTDGSPAKTGEWLARVARLEQTPGGVRVRVVGPDVAIDVSTDRAIDLGLASGRDVVLRVAAEDVRLS